MSYYIKAVGRNYNIVIKATAIGGSGEIARFRSYLETCNSTRLFPVDCNVGITYSWTDNTPGSGTSTVTLPSGSSGVVDTPSGYTLTSISVTGIDISSCTYNTAIFCGDPFVTTTTTTTTTTSTTTTTTTVAASNPGTPAIKYDQYSGSYNSGTRVWPNIGVSSSLYSMSNYYGPPSAVVTAGGSGDATYLDMTGFMYGPVNDQFYEPPLVGDFISLGNMSFSYSIVFQYLGNLEAPFGVYFTGLPNSFSAGINRSEVVEGSDYINFFILQMTTTNKPLYLSAEVIPNLQVNKWYLFTFVFNKNWSNGNQTALYLNTIPTQINIENASTLFYGGFFDGPIWNHSLSNNPATSRIAAVLFWQNKALTPEEIQFVYEEYNTRYTLG